MKTKQLIYAFALLMYAFASNAQTYSRVRDEYFGTGLPIFSPASYPATAIDTNTKVLYYRVNSTSTWRRLDGFLAATNLPQTATPDQPNTSLLLPYAYPQNYGAIGEDKTFAQLGWTQAQIDAKYPNIGATAADNIDWAATTLAINECMIYGKTLMTSGNLYFGNKTLWLPKNLLNFMWLGGGTIIRSRAPYIISREVPADNGDANTMIQAQYLIQSVRVICQQSQTQIGMRFFSVYPLTITDIKIAGASKAFNMIFCLQGYALNCEANSSIDGFYLEDGVPYYPTTKDQSQCNVFAFQSCRVYAPKNGRYGFYYRTSNTIYNYNPVLEGWSYDSGIMIAGNNSTTVKSFRIIGLHYEATGSSLESIPAARTAAINVELLGGMVIIDDPYGQHPSRMVRAKATGGYVTIKVMNTMWWMPDAAGKYFQNDGGVSWAFEDNDNNLYSINPSAMFSGSIPSLATSQGQGWNVYTYKQLPRR